MLKEITREEYTAYVINNIKEDKKKVRQSSKSPFFLL
jgi:hypothetical protein